MWYVCWKLVRGQASRASPFVLQIYEVAGRETEGGLLTFPSPIWSYRGPLIQQVRRSLGNLSERGREGKSVVKDFRNCL